jgi:hypothetical protein
MNYLKNPLVIGGATIFLIIVGLAWNYTETIKTKNEIERERIVSEERTKQAELEQKRSEAEAVRLQEQIQAEKDAEPEEQEQQPKPVTRVPSSPPKLIQQEESILEQEDSTLKIERCKVSAQQRVDADKKAELPAIMQMARDSCNLYPDGTDICFLNKTVEISKLKEGIWAQSYMKYYSDCINQ